MLHKVVPMQHLYAVQSIAELREFDPFYSAQLRTSGYQNPGDGGGGDFYWDAEDMQPDDGGLVFKSKLTTKGRWRRISTGSWDIRQFGALPASGDVTQQFQHALDACHKGGSLYIPSGHYTIRQSLRVHQGTTVHGDGLLSEIHYYGPAKTGCWNAAQRSPATAMTFKGLNTFVHTQNTRAYTLTGMSFSRFDNLFVHLRCPNTSAYYGPANGESPYYNVFTNCHASGPGGDSNGCIAFDWAAYDDGVQAPNANQVFGGHINSLQIAVRCQGTGNIFHGQVLEMVDVGYEFDLPKNRYDDASKGISNDVMGLYTEYAKVVFEQRHETCYLTAQTCMITGHKELFHGKSKENCVLLSNHSGQLPVNRSFFEKAINFHPLEFDE